MSVLREKLNSRRGASILLALVFLLLCMMVASVILTSATANAGKITQRRNEQKAYLSVSSAANLLKEAVGSAQYERSETELYYSCWESPYQGSFTDSCEPTQYDTTAGVVSGGAAAQLLRAGADRVFLENCQYSAIHKGFGTTPYTAQFTVEPESGKDLYSVKGKLTMARDGQLTITLRAGSTEAADDYVMTLTFRCAIAQQSNTYTGVNPTEATREDLTHQLTCQHTYTYYDTVSKTDVTSTAVFNTAFTVHTVDLTWNTPVISKGGDSDA